MIIKKAVIPAAGLGTRFLPVTRAVPKVMLPILDIPAIEYAVREAAGAGIEQAVIVISEPTIREMGDYHLKHKGSVIAARKVSVEEIPNLGIFDAGVRDENFFTIKTMIEKPPLEAAPSNLAIVGRYVLTPRIFDALADTSPGAKGEIQLTDGLNLLMSDEEAYGYEFSGQHFDVGTPLGMLKASVFAAMKREDLSADLKDWLTQYT